jgi:hypothetical protein
LCNRAQTLDTATPTGVLLTRDQTPPLTRASPCEARSAFTRVAARTLARSPIRDQLHRRLQPFCHLHDCSGCFRLERLPGGACTHWKAPPWHGAHVKWSFRIAENDRSAGIDVRERPGEPGMPISMGSVSAPYGERAGRPGALEPELDGPNLLPDEPKPAILELSLHRQS